MREEGYNIYKLIVVDDEVASRDTICGCFPWSEFGFEVVGQFDNGLYVLEYLKAHHVDVILSDVVMPCLSGIELAKAVYEQYSDGVKMIFLSGYSEFEYAKKALTYGVVGYILKPAKYSELAETFAKLRTLLDSKTAEPQEKDEVPEEIHPIISMVKEYVEENYRTANLTKAAQLVYMNPSYLSQFFKKNTGMKFSDYIMQVRMEKSRQLLQELDLKVYNISDMVGYSDPQNFTRAFKRYWGNPPEYYRGYRGKDNQDEESSQ